MRDQLVQREQLPVRRNAFLVFGYAADGRWEGAGTIVGLRTRLENQPRGLQLEYRVVGVNAAGEGAPSGVVSVVL